MFSATLFCDVCGAVNRSQAQFCSSCGTRLYGINVGTVSHTLTGLLVPRHLLNRRYRVLEQVGRGGFGAVYKAEDLSFGNRLVAVKEMSQNNLSASEVIEAVKAFKQEALLLAGLKHPNLPTIYEQFTDSGRWYLVMDFIEGETLESKLQRVGSGQGLSLERVLEIAIQLCSLLDYLHTRQPPVIFRDLKPANVMLTAEGHVYLIDFGIARHFKPGQAKDTAAFGSTGYAAPEQYGKAQTTAQTDLYGLGATLHQMLSGDDPSEAPFHFAPLRVYPEHPQLSALVKQLLEIPVQKRPASAAAVKQQLQEIARLAVSLTPARVSGGTTVSIPAPPGYQRPSTMRRVAVPQPQPNTLFICKGHRSRVTSVIWSPDGQRVASASYDKTVRLWDVATGKALCIYRGHTERVNALAWSPNGKYIASASNDATVQIWEAAHGTLFSVYRGHASPVNALSWSADNMYLASGDKNGQIQIWQIAAQSPLKTLKNHSASITALNWAPDSKRLASASEDKTVQIDDPLRAQRSGFFTTILNVLRTALVYSNHSARINALSWAPDGKYLASCGADKTVQVWDALTGRRSFVHAHGSVALNSVAWSSNNRAIAFGSNDKTVQIWDVPTRKPLATYQGHANYVTAVAWSPDGSRIVSGSVDRTVQIWQAR